MISQRDKNIILLDFNEWSRGRGRRGISLADVNAYIATGLILRLVLVADEVRDLLLNELPQHITSDADTAGIHHAFASEMHHYPCDRSTA